MRALASLGADFIKIHHTPTLAGGARELSAEALAGIRANEHLARAECEALIQLIADYRADCVVDAWNPFACLAARAALQSLVTDIQVDMHPGNPGFVWWRQPPPNLPTPASVVSRVLARYRLPPISQVAELFVGDLTLVVGMPETDPVPATAPVTYIGPALWQPHDTVLPDWWDKLDSNRPIIWVYSDNPRYLSIASPVDSLVVLQACVAALAPLDVQVVLTTGFHDLPLQVSPLPANFHFAPFVSGVAMARRSQFLIHHGDYGACQTGLVAGTPAVIIPTAQSARATPDGSRPPARPNLSCLRSIGWAASVS